MMFKKLFFFVNLLMAVLGFSFLGACGQVDIPQERSAASQRAGASQGAHGAKLLGEKAREGAGSPAESIGIASLLAEFKEGMPTSPRPE